MLENVFLYSTCKEREERSGRGKKRAEGARKRWVYRNGREGEKVKIKSMCLKSDNEMTLQYL